MYYNYYECKFCNFIMTIIINSALVKAATHILFISLDINVLFICTVCELKTRINILFNKSA